MSEEFSTYIRGSLLKGAEIEVSEWAWQACAAIKDQQLAEQLRVATEIGRQQLDTIEKIAAENEALRAAFEDVKRVALKAMTERDAVGYFGVLDLISIYAKEALATPSLGAEALRKRDAETLRKAAEKFEEGHPHITRVGVCQMLYRLAEELEKP